MPPGRRAPTGEACADGRERKRAQLAAAQLARALLLNSSRKGSISAGRIKVLGTKSKWPGAAAAMRFIFLARSFLRQISSMPTKWLIFW